MLTLFFYQPDILETQQHLHKKNKKVQYSNSLSSLEISLHFNKASLLERVGFIPLDTKFFTSA